MDLPRDHRGKTECDPHRSPSTPQVRSSAGRERDTLEGRRSTAADRTPEGDGSTLRTRAGIALTSIALALLFESLLGTSSTVILYCVIVAFGIGWRIRHAGLLLVATVALTANTVVPPSVLMFSSSGALRVDLASHLVLGRSAHQLAADPVVQGSE